MMTIMPIHIDSDLDQDCDSEFDLDYEHGYPDGKGPLHTAFLFNALRHNPFPPHTTVHILPTLSCRLADILPSE